jgi:hypothetical protein
LGASCAFAQASRPGRRFSLTCTFPASPGLARGFGVGHRESWFRRRPRRLAGLCQRAVLQRALFVRIAKSLFLRFVELALLYGACLLLGRLAESRLHGAPYPQSWEFYVIGVCLFLVAAFPGFIYRYMWRKDH